MMQKTILIEEKEEEDWVLIKLDFDTLNDSNIRKALETLKDSQIRVSPSKRGFHVKGWYYCKYSERFDVREKLGDDSVRVKFDKKREGSLQPTDVLWSTKVKDGITYKAGAWKDWSKIKNNKKLPF